MKYFALACAALLLMWLVALAISRLRARRRRRQLEEQAFTEWMDQVDGILRQYTRDRYYRPTSQWRADYEAGLAPDQSARSLLAFLHVLGRPDPARSNVVSTSWSMVVHNENE
jgi:hypothetical protein